MCGMVAHVIESIEGCGYMDVGDTYHGLKLLAYCGGGAFGEVFYCEDVTHRKMAVKIINKKHLDGQCLRELKGITNYRRITENNPNLLQIYHVEEDENTFYYTMEPADSLSDTEYKADTLAARLSKGPIPDAEIYPMLSNIFQGIKALHTAGFAHRDIKPDNILFVKGVPKLADMGLLSSLSMTMSTIAGTFIFIPPEIRSSDNWDAYDSKSRQRSDLYAFGKVIYCVVTGLAPESYPTLPVSLQITPSTKYFINLSASLCEKDPKKRLTVLNKVESEFNYILQIIQDYKKQEKRREPKTKHDLHILFILFFVFFIISYLYVCSSAKKLSDYLENIILPFSACAFTSAAALAGVYLYRAFKFLVVNYWEIKKLMKQLFYVITKRK